MRSAAVLLLAVSVAAPTPPPAFTNRQMRADRAILAQLPAILGETVWSCADAKPRTRVADEILEPAWRLMLATVREHERAHRVWALGYGSCPAAATASWVQANRVDNEVAAFCAGVREGVRVGWYGTMDEGVRDAAYALANYYPFGLTYDAALARVRACVGLSVTGSD